MKYLILSLCLFFLQPAFAQLVINDPNAELRSVPAFNSVEVSGAIDLLLSKGETPAVAVSTGHGSNEEIVTEVKNGVLHLYVKPGSRRILKRSSYKVYVSYAALKAVTGSGASSIKFTEPFEGDRFSLNLSGASTVKGRLSVARLQIELSGASDATIDGSSEQLILSSSGASDFRAYDFKTVAAMVTASGASGVRLSVSGSLKAHASGASNIFYRGEPKTEINASGNSTVAARN